MAIPKPLRTKPKSRSPIWLLTITISAIALLYLFSSLLSTTGSNPLQTPILQFNNNNNHEGLGHQKSSLRCALEEEIVLKRFDL
ncbi:hypothetical protein Hanom_Chr17g01558021 [Helianthus anomalus]